MHVHIRVRVRVKLSGVKVFHSRELASNYLKLNELGGISLEQSWNNRGTLEHFLSWHTTNCCVFNQLEKKCVRCVSFVSGFVSENRLLSYSY